MKYHDEIATYAKSDIETRGIGYIYYIVNSSHFDIASRLSRRCCASPGARRRCTRIELTGWNIFSGDLYPTARHRLAMTMIFICDR